MSTTLTKEAATDPDSVLDDLFEGVVVDSIEDMKTEQQQEDADQFAEWKRQVEALAIEDAGRDGYLFFDLETVPDETRFPRPVVPEPVALTIDLPTWMASKAATVDAIKESLGKVIPREQIDEIESIERASPKPRKGVLEACEAARNGGNAEFAEWQKYALNPIKGRICALGWAIGSGDVRSIVAKTDEEERVLLRAWWKLFADKRRQHVGFNQVSFDAAMIGVRSIILGVRGSRSLDRRKYNNPQAIDVMNLLDVSGTCKDICRAFGIEIPAGEMDGSQVLGLWDAQQWDAIGEYVRSDVTVERELFWMVGDVFGAE